MNIDDQLSALISSTYQVLTPMDTVCHTNMMIYRIRSILNDQLDEAQQYKDVFHQNAMQPILFDVLSEIKQQNGLNLRQISIGNDAYDQELARLDAVLITERIIEPYPNELSDSNNSSVDTEHPDYQMNLTRIRQFYHDEFDKFTKNSNDFCTHVVTLLQQQSQIRPISKEEMTQMISIVRNKLCLIQIQLKQYTCEAVMNLRRRFFDAKRKRRSFDKATQQVFNAYFYSHLSNPYPSEQVKEDLARKCHVTIAQVNNWFGNKRGRYKKNMRRNE